MASVGPGIMSRVVDKDSEWLVRWFKFRPVLSQCYWQEGQLTFSRPELENRHSNTWDAVFHFVKYICRFSRVSLERTAWQQLHRGWSVRYRKLLKSRSSGTFPSFPDCGDLIQKFPPMTVQCVHVMSRGAVSCQQCKPSCRRMVNAPCWRKCRDWTRHVASRRRAAVMSYSSSWLDLPNSLSVVMATASRRWRQLFSSRCSPAPTPCQ